MGRRSVEDKRRVSDEPHEWGQGIEFPDEAFDVCLRCGLVRRKRGEQVVFGAGMTWEEEAPACRERKGNEHEQANHLP